MPKKLSNAEKQRRYRLKRDADPEKRASYLAHKKQKYQSDLSLGKRKSVAKLTDRQKRQQRKKWKKNQAACRLSKRDQLTPPDSPDEPHPNPK